MSGVAREYWFEPPTGALGVAAVHRSPTFLAGRAELEHVVRCTRSSRS